MKYLILICAFFLLPASLSYSQPVLPDSSKSVKLDEVIVIAERLPILLKKNTGSLSIVTSETLSSMPKSIGAEEALRFVPGVRIDNQHDGERVHLSMRGQGILTERGLRGIGVIIDGIPVNDPSGFAPDLYDVEWGSVKNIEVLRGPVAGLYGGSGAGGVLVINTRSGGVQPLGGTVSQSLGSNGFTKSLVALDGSKKDVDYNITFSHGAGDGYRDHQAFRSNKLYEKLNFHPSPKLLLTQVISYTSYFQQNPEGLNVLQFDNLKQANPDARPFNEYQKTSRITIGLSSKYKISNSQDIDAVVFVHSGEYKETSNKCAEYRNITNPGANVQYNLRLGTGKVKNNFSLGSDLKWQDIGMYKLQSAADTLRKESVDESNIETNVLLANQVISQRSLGAYALYKLEAGKLTLTGSIRYDDIHNGLNDKMMGADSSRTSFSNRKTSMRAGASYSISNIANLFASVSQGFMPPSTEELASNPVGYSGFNTHLVPATSVCSEIGIRGLNGTRFYYEITGFLMNTQNDFFRFKQTGRGNQEVFYGNAGNSHRLGIESFISMKVVKDLSIQAAYTYSDFKYTSSAIDPVYTNQAYVLTVPPVPGQWLPNSPRHQLYAEISYSILKKVVVTFGTEAQSEWAVYTDANAYSGKLDKAIYQNWQSGFNLYNASVSYSFDLSGLKSELRFSSRNLGGINYMAFTEPDPDGNAYHPGPGREFFLSLKVEFNH